MKKILTALLAVCICISLCSCSKNAINEESENSPDTIQAAPSTSTTEKIIESTTKLPEKNTAKGSRLEAILKSTLSDGEITGELDYGKFNFKSSRDISVMYQNEGDAQTQKTAEENVHALIQDISSLYNDEITLHSFETEQIGSGENGIDSVLYKFYYINTQKQLLTVYADSTGVIIYADCAFTW